VEGFTSMIEMLTDIPPKDRNIGLVFQNWALYPHMRVFDNIAFPLELRKVPKREIEKKVREVSKMLHIENLLHRYPWQLSGGQQQRVARIAVIKDGKILQVGTPDDVYHKPKYRFVGGFLGNPPMNFVEAEVEDGYLRIYGSKIPIPTQYKELIEKLNIIEVVLGFRPHDAEIVKGIADGLVGEVYSFEPLGREQIVTVSLDGVSVKVFAPEEESFTFGEKVSVKIRENRIILFDKKTEKALEFIEEIILR